MRRRTSDPAVRARRARAGRQRITFALALSGATILGLAACAQGRPALDAPAGSVVAGDLIDMAADAVGATGTAGWTYEDGSPWDPSAPDIIFSGEPCGPTDNSEAGRFLEFGLVGPPASVEPGDARDQMRGYLERNGYEVTRSMDPPPGNEPKNMYIVTGRRADGAFVDYGANNAEQLLTLRSQCSAHPSMKGDVSAETR